MGRREPQPPAAPVLRVLTYDPAKPSFRYRIAPLLAEMERRGWQCAVDVLPQRRYGLRVLERTPMLQASDAVLLHKLRLAPWETRWVAHCQPALAFDLDDANWLSQPKAPGQAPRPSASRERAFAGLCQGTRLTMAGNAALADQARRHGGRRVEEVPTAVDVAAYPAPDLSLRRGLTAVWIGLPGNLQYLAPLRPVLAALGQRWPGFRLRVVSSRFPDWPEVPLERVPWAPGIEHHVLGDADIGLMPLADDAFTRGKCAFKLLQYMAAGVACIASPVGANVQVVQPGVSGWLADSPQAWQQAFESLLGDRALRDAMGLAGRARVLEAYDTRVVIPRAASLMESLAGSLAGSRSGSLVATTDSRVGSP